MRDEGVVGQHRAGRDHLGAGDDEAGVGLLLDMAADVGDLVRRPVAIDRRMDDGVIDERHALLAELVPALGVLLVGIVEVGIGAERGQERGLVVGRAADPAVGDPRPFGDRVAAGDQIVDGLRRLEEGVRHAAIAGVGRQQELVLALVVVQRVVEARDHARGVAEGRMGGDVLDPLAVDVDGAVVAQRVQIFRAGLRTGDFDVADVLRRDCRCRVALRLACHCAISLGSDCSIIELMSVFRTWRDDTAVPVDLARATLGSDGHR